MRKSPNSKLQHFPTSRIRAANVSSVKQRSPLRYPGGKTWLIPHIQDWLRSMPYPQKLIEPFCGGGIVSLTTVAEDLAEQSYMADIDKDIAAFWKAALRRGPELRERIAAFKPTHAAITALESECYEDDDVVSTGFRTLVLNRTRRGGILAPGAALIRSGENGKGVSSRWYPETLVTRLKNIEEYSHRIKFDEKDGIQLLRDELTGDNVVVFADPPYTVGGKRAGARLYQHSEINHGQLFEILAGCDTEFLMTYNYSSEVEELIRNHDFYAVKVDMKNTHHARIPELVITNRPVFSE